ncbi:MAG: hypothetical protein WCT27_03370 [Patescibacteria group bacterium]
MEVLMAEIREFSFTEILEMVVDPNTLVGAEQGNEHEMNLRAGTILVRRCVAPDSVADIVGAGTITNTSQAISCLTDLINNSVSFTTSVVRDGKTFKFEWLAR